VVIIFIDLNTVFLQWQIQGRGLGGPPPLFLDKSEAQKAEIFFFETAPPPPLSRAGSKNELTKRIENI